MSAMRSLAVAVLVAASAAGGWWVGSRDRLATDGAGSSQPTGVPDSPGPRGGSGPVPVAGRKLLYYRNPMGLPDTSPVPKKDPMGMDYIPVYEDEAAATDSPGSVVLSPAKIQKLGVRTELASLRAVERSIRASGRVEVDERRVYTVAPRFEGWVERLDVNVTGQVVARGQSLFEVYSPELVSAQREYLLALQGIASLKDAGPDAQAGMRQLADAALARLRNWEVSAEQIEALVRTGQVRQTLTLRAPAGGVVTEKKAVQGMRFMAGEAMYQISDLSSVWVIADVVAQDIGAVRHGTGVRITIDAFPGRQFDGRIAYIYPTMNPGTRTVPVRIELRNPGGLLKPAMFAEVALDASSARQALTVPNSAIIDSGTRRIVLVNTGDGRFEPRPVKLGERGDSHVEVLSGVTVGEAVVVSANFLIDSESNLRAALQAFGPGGEMRAPQARTPVFRANGIVDTLDAAALTVSISHEPIAALKWPAMTMDFSLANSALAEALQAGRSIAFEFVERKPGEWVVTRVEARTVAPAGESGTHKGH